MTRARIGHHFLRFCEKKSQVALLVDIKGRTLASCHGTFAQEHLYGSIFVANCFEFDLPQEVPASNGKKSLGCKLLIDTFGGRKKKHLTFEGFFLQKKLCCLFMILEFFG